jgi:SAM-dependent methyltransferase
VAQLRASRIPLFPLIVAREKLASGERVRVPEPMVMDERQSVVEFDQGGEDTQVPVHHFNSLGISRLLPEGGTLMDLGCGSGRLLARLARGRPDVRIIGLDLSDPMLETGRQMLEHEGLGNVELRRGDVTTFDSGIAERPDVVSCNWTLHQLPSEELASECLAAIARARSRWGCAVWVFDFARLRHPRTWPAVLSMLKSLGPALRKDGIASEQAAFTMAELTRLLERAGLGDLEGARSRPLGEYQVHWAERRDGRSSSPGRWRDYPLPGGTSGHARRQLRAFPPALTSA